MGKSNKIRLFEIKVSGASKFYGYCTIIKEKSAIPSVTIQIDNEFIEEINPHKIPVYTTNNGLFTYIPYDGNDTKFATVRLYIKMWTSVTLFALRKHIDPKNLFSLVLYCTKNREGAPEIILRKWEKDNEKINFPGISEFIEKATAYNPENKIHDWVKDKINMYVSVQEPEPC